MLPAAWRKLLPLKDAERHVCSPRYQEEGAQPLGEPQRAELCGLATPSRLPGSAKECHVPGQGHGQRGPGLDSPGKVKGEERRKRKDREVTKNPGDRTGKLEDEACDSAKGQDGIFPR